MVFWYRKLVGKYNEYGLRCAAFSQVDILLGVASYKFWRHNYVNKCNIPYGKYCGHCDVNTEA